MDSIAARRVGELVEAMLLAPVLRPMIAGVSILGDYETDVLARELAQHDRGGFAALIAARLEQPR